MERPPNHSGPFFCPDNFVLSMRPYPLPKDITREEFNRLVTGLCQLLTEKGLDPVNHLTDGAFNDTANGTARPRFALYVSFTATELLLTLNSK